MYTAKVESENEHDGFSGFDLPRYLMCVLSFQANYKINAAKLYYEIYSLSQRLRLTTIRVEHEEEVRTKVYFYVLYLRHYNPLLLRNRS